MKRALTALLALALPTTAAAQSHDIIRDRFPFISSRITVQVQVDAPGRLNIVRGQPGFVTVTGRMDGGIATAALDRRNRLTLNAAGDGLVNYVVSVPSDVRVHVVLPTGPVATLGARNSGQRYEWGIEKEPVDRAPVRPPLLTPPPDDPLGPRLFTVFYSSTAPDTVRLPDPSVIRSVSVRFEGNVFRVGASRPFSVRPGDTDVVEIRPADPPIDIVLMMPLRTTGFSLELGPDTPLLVREGDVSVHCKPAIQQRLSGGRVWITFSTRAGETLECETPPEPRHKG